MRYLARKVAYRYLAAKKTLYRAMNLRQLQEALSTNRLDSKWDSYVSFTEDWSRLKGQHDVAVEFKYVPATKIKYTKDWFLQHPDIARYVVSEDRIGHPTPEELAEQAARYSHEKEWVARAPMDLPTIEHIRVLNESVRDRVEELAGRYIEVI